MFSLTKVLISIAENFEISNVVVAFRKRSFTWMNVLGVTHTIFSKVWNVLLPSSVLTLKSALSAKNCIKSSSDIFIVEPFSKHGWCLIEYGLFYKIHLPREKLKSH